MRPILMHDFWWNQDDAGRYSPNKRFGPQTRGLPGVSLQVVQRPQVSCRYKWPRDEAWKSIRSREGCDWFGNQSDASSQPLLVASANRSLAKRGARDCVTGLNSKVLEILL